MSNKVEDCFKFLWPFQNFWTLSQCFLNKNNDYNSMCRARLTCMTVAARQRFAFFFHVISTLLHLLLMSIDTRSNMCLKLCVFPRLWMFFFNLFSILLSSFCDIVALLFLFFAVLMIAISVILMTPVICSIS